MTSGRFDPGRRPPIVTDVAASDHDLIVSYGDCEFWGRCSCGTQLGPSTRPDESLDLLGMRWEKHVMARAER